MTETSLQKVRAVLAKRKAIIFASEEPQKVSAEYLQKAGYLDSNGNIAPEFKAGTLATVSPKKRQRLSRGHLSKARKRLSANGHPSQQAIKEPNFKKA